MLALVTALLCSCDGEPLRQCPDPSRSAILIHEHECACRSNTAHFVDGAISCSRCDSQDADGIYCICEDKSLMDVTMADCVECPSAPCQERECSPAGCANDCAHPPCAFGSFCNPEGACESCDGRCGSDCPCPPGSTCAAGQCMEITRCCKSSNTCPGAVADWCVAPGIWPLGSACFCRQAYPNGNFCDELGELCEF